MLEALFSQVRGAPELAPYLRILLFRVDHSERDTTTQIRNHADSGTVDINAVHSACRSVNRAMRCCNSGNTEFSAALNSVESCCTINFCKAGIPCEARILLITARIAKMILVARSGNSS